MSTSAIFGMIVIIGIVIGGFIFFLNLAMKNEKRKKNE
jgi:hypothetical protein